MSAQIIAPQPKENPLLEAALRYAAIGWHILPCWGVEKNEAGALRCACGNAACKSPGKHPIHHLVAHGQSGATTDAALIRSWWAQVPQANIAVFLEPSGLCAIDIDPRNGGFQTMDDLEAQHSPLLSDLLQFTGGGGEHRVFLAPKNSTLPGKLGAGVDVKLNGYIMLEPSNHVSGGVYAWEAMSDPRDGLMASPLPDWLRDLAGRPVALGAKALAAPGTTGGRVMPITLEQRAEILQAMDAIPSDNRDTWLQVGMALQSTGDSQWAWDTWDGWSAQSVKYNKPDQLRVWRSFSGKGLDGITYKTIFGIAKALGVVIKTQAAPVPLASVAIKREVKVEIDESLLHPPGMLGEVADWINATARKPQPQFAVQTAIAFGCTVLGRRFCTDRQNWPSLYLLNIGLSSSGKEYAKTALEQLLEACGLGQLIGPSSYTSNSGVLSALHTQPNHVTVIDEFHRTLEQASVKGNARAQSMLTSLIEVWGRTNGTLRPQGYSTFGMTPKEAQQIQERSVRNPALSLLAMAIPQFFETIGSAAARDGFLNRFLIVETTVGRSVGRHGAFVPVPQSVVEWTQAIRSRYTGMVDPDTNAAMGVEPVIVPMSEQAMGLFSAFDAQCIELMDQHDADGLAEMFGRSNEMAMKLALVVALGRSAEAVEGVDAQWAINYVRTYALQVVNRLLTCVSDSEFEAVKKQVLNLIVGKGEHGATVAELSRASRLFRGADKRQQINILDSMAYLGQVQLVTHPSQSGRGKPREAWVAVDDQPDDQDVENDE